jgi:hypothetical protein
MALPCKTHMPTSSTSRGHTSVESNHRPRHRPTRQTPAEPTRRRQALHEPSRSMSRRDARSPTRDSRAPHTSRRFRLGRGAADRARARGGRRGAAAPAVLDGVRAARPHPDQQGAYSERLRWMRSGGLLSASAELMWQLVPPRAFATDRLVVTALGHDEPTTTPRGSSQAEPRGRNRSHMINVGRNASRCSNRHETAPRRVNVTSSQGRRRLPPSSHPRSTGRCPTPLPRQAPS